MIKIERIRKLDEELQSDFTNAKRKIEIINEFKLAGIQVDKDTYIKKEQDIMKEYMEGFNSEANEDLVNACFQQGKLQ